MATRKDVLLVFALGLLTGAAYSAYQVLVRRNLRELERLAGGRIRDRTIRDVLIPDYREEFFALASIISDLQQRASFDALTGLPNRSQVLSHMFNAVEDAAESGQSVSVIHIDADRFKTINDEHSHAAGDAVLRDLAAILKSFRNECAFGRMGGEEFIGTMLGDGTDLAERVRAAVEAHEFSHLDVPIPLTVSIGVAVQDAGRSHMEHLIGAADKAGRRAKEHGRNRVEVIR